MVFVDQHTQLADTENIIESCLKSDTRYQTGIINDSYDLVTNNANAPGQIQLGKMGVTLRYPADQYASAHDENWATGSDVVVRTGRARNDNKNFSKKEFLSLT